MADLALGVVKDIVKTGMAIKEALETFRQNEEECQKLQGSMATTIAVLSWLQEMELRSHPAMCVTLMDLNGSLDGALKLVTKCQKKKSLRRLLMAGGMAKQLRRVHDDIQLKMLLVNLAINASMMQVTIEFTRTTIVRHDGAHPLFTQPQGAAEMEIYSSHSTTGDARSEEDGAAIITTVTTGTEAPFALSSSNIASSGLTEFSLSETVATHHVSEDNISGGSDYTTIVTKHKFVIKMSMTCDKSRSKAMELVAMAGGIKSVCIAGDGKDHLDVVGRGVDLVALISALRKKVGYAQLVEFTMVKQEDKDYMYSTVLSAMDRTSAMEAQPTVVSAEEAQHRPANRWTRTRGSGFRAITARISRFMRPRAHPPPSPLRVEDTDNPEQAAATGPPPRSRLVRPATPPADYSAQLSQLHLPALEAPAMAEDDLFFATTTTDHPLLQQHQPEAARAPVRRRRRTFNMSRVHRSVRLPSARRHSRTMPRTQPSSSEKSGDRVLQLLVSCALCTLVLLLASIWALRQFPSYLSPLNT